MVISIVGALLAGAASLLKAVRLPVLAAAEPYAWQQAQHRWLKLQSSLALAVLAAAGFLLWYGDSLVSGFAVLAALLLGAALILPAILGLVLSLGQRRADRALTVWFWADSRQQLSGLSLAESKHKDRKSTRLNSSHQIISYAVFCLKKKKSWT